MFIKVTVNSEEIMKFFTAFSGIPLRPLLLAAGVAATAAGFFYHIDLGDEERAPADPEDTTGPKGKLFISLGLTMRC